ncbi:hypothetical protein HN031_03110 [Nocardioides sp. zg-1308]|uniref:Capsular polysaccharide biosynthesis protein n=1 Tax=Nocardioides renjunii TaxID=3095075 RepID=A0ABU5K6F6_9ACTN|nr:MULTISPECIES: hypothetical protein [unclassified Nocardioides]MDZ5660555.1 hypothetical protein [Nocardioides sp. S-58]NPD03671.1 hypothetical protein [Nocardioides sp. zg-1308]
MELKVFWRTLRRRWYLSLVVMALTVAATAYVVRDVGPSYEAEGSALVFPPASSIRSEGATKTVGNPYLELAGVAQARDVVIRTLKSRTVQTDWGEQFPGMSYEATPDFTNSAPIILFTVEGGTSTGAAAALDDLMARVPLILVDLQEGLGLSEDGFVTARKLTQDARPAIVRKNQIRAGLLTAAAAGGLGLLLLALVDSLLGVRARSRAQQDAARAAEEDPDGPDDEPVEQVTSLGVDDPGDEAGTADEADGPVEEDAPAEEVPMPIYTYRIPLASEMAVSPARSRWSRATRRGDSARDAHRGGNGETPPSLMGLNGPQARERGPWSATPVTRPRTRAPGKNR